MSSPHELLNPAGLAAPTGFSHVVLPADGRPVVLGGQAAQLADGSIGGETMVEQFDLAAANVVAALAAAGAEPGHLVSMLIFVTDAAAYRAELRAIGQVYRRHFGAHYPAIAFLEVAGLFDPAALVELVCIAVVPDQRGAEPTG